MPNWTRKAISKLRGGRTESIGPFVYKGPPPEDLENRGEFEQLFWRNTGPVVHKWHHYLPLYDRYFGPFRGRHVRMLEIGVSKGGSLQLWRQYFGDDATIFGIDIDPACAALDGQAGQVRIGSQDDPDFLMSTVEEMGGCDLVLDDGSHLSRHIRASLNTLFPVLDVGGVYMIEDLHATYWPSREGGYGLPESFISDVKTLIDDLHHWYHEEGQKITATRDQVAGIHVHDSICVIEKANVQRPAHTRVGGG